MPLESYTYTHGDAKLTAEQIKWLVNGQKMYVLFMPSQNEVLTFNS